MAKARSPSYPTIGLKEAIEKVRLIYDKDYTNPISPTVAAEHMGYRGLSGTSLGTLSALKKYGLLEGRGEETRVSDVAVTIIAHPPGAPERTAAIREAAARPELFAELEGRFQGGRPSDQAIRSYLLTQKFIPIAADAALRSYRETKQLVETESLGYESADSEGLEGGQVYHLEATGIATGSPSMGQPTVTVGSVPFRVSIQPSGLEITARITTVDELDNLIDVLQANRAFLAKVIAQSDGGR